MADAAIGFADIEHILPLWLILVPLGGSFLVYWTGRFGEAWRNTTAILIALFTFLLAAKLFVVAQNGDVVYHLASFLDVGLQFRVDMLGALFALLSSFIWLLATIFSWTYMSHEDARSRYYSFLTLSLAGCLGVFVTADFFGLLLFFEIMSFAAYVLVIHAQTEEAMEAGHSYLYMGIIGGLVMLAAIFILYYYAGTVAIEPLLESLALPAPLLELAIALFILGFGIKAGMLPLHIWLPKAHPVAPSPASALLSAIMIKTGAYGIIRVVNMFYTPRNPGVPFWEQTASLGYLVIWIGIATMFVAAFIALFQTNTKRILAYSSISQMGYILMGAGCAAYLGYEGGAMGFSGAVYHIINHAFFKAGLFMLVGAVYARTHQLDLSRLGGLYRNFPVTAAVFLICAAGITGIPGFNGYISKTLLHHAIIDAFALSNTISLFWAEKIFTLTSAFTVCYIARLFISIFFGRRPQALPVVAPEPLAEKLVFVVLALGVLLLGLFPSRVMALLVLPAARGFSYDSFKIEYMGKLGYFSAPDLQGIAIAVGLGLAMFLLFRAKNVFAWQPPAWLSVEGLIYRPAVRGAAAAFTTAGKGLEYGTETVMVGSITPLARVSGRMSAWDEKFDLLFLHPLLRSLGCIYSGTAGLLDRGAEGAFVQSLPALYRLSGRVSAVDTESAGMAGRVTMRIVLQLLNFAFQCWIALAGALDHLWKEIYRRSFKLLIKVDYDPKGDSIFQRISFLNIDFDFIIIFVIFVGMLALVFLL